MRIEDLVEGAARGLADAIDDSTSQKAYEDRNLLALTLAVTRKRIGCDAGYYYHDESDWPVVWTVLPAGQVSWHVPPEFEQHLAESCLDAETPVGGYDGHDRRLKNDRLLAEATGTTDRLHR
ncbi:hypothetical protein [Haloarchaeobius sp. HRN-SO-5]|uniref:hypothetical protein n=1 Tax=Haloarchaeobius sp. HRN-SO-5 TaxID=3446118 RepID=UPI003EB73841